MILTGRRQRRVLDTMHTALRASDPRLVATFATFTRLTKDEAIPQIERVRATLLNWLRSVLRHPWRHLRRFRIQMTRPRNRRLAGALFLPTLAAGMFAMVLLMSQGQPQADCPAAHTATTASGRHQTAHPGTSAACRYAVQTGLMPIGR